MVKASAVNPEQQFIQPAAATFTLYSFLYVDHGAYIRG